MWHLRLAYPSSAIVVVVAVAAGTSSPALELAVAASVRAIADHSHLQK